MNLQNRTILVVEDSLTIRMQTKELLQENGFEVLLAKNGCQCLQVLEDEKPDIILLDIIMPEMDGIEACRRIKADERLNKIPILILTAQTDVNSKVKGLDAGADDYIVKPFEIEELMARVKSVMRRIELQEQLQKEQDKYKFLVENTTDVIWTADMNLNTTYVSPSVIRMVGYTPQEIIAQTLEERYVPSSIKAINKVFSEELANENDKNHDPGRSRVLELQVKCKDGRIIWIEMTVTFKRDPNGLLQGVHGIYRDITKRKEAELALKITNVELEESKKMLEGKANQSEMANINKSKFLANMSHELRSPLNSILILSDMLAQNKEGNLFENQVKCAATVNSSGKDLLELIDEILDLAKVESGKIEILPDNVCLEDVKMTMDRYYTYQANAIGVDFSVRIEKDLPDYIHTDSQRLNQILKNLLSNALKFTDKGSITLSVSRPPADTDLARIRLDGLNHNSIIAFSISDTGLGIPEDKLDHVFEAYSQAEKTTSRDFGGTGLGLPISRMLAQLLGGDIIVTSKEHVGSTFTLYIPESIKEKKDEMKPETIENHAAATNKVDSNIKAVPLPENKTILMAEDDMRNAFALSGIIEARGADVIITKDGRQCIEKLEEYSDDIDLVLMDMKMPEMDGYEAMTKIKKMEPFSKLPIIAITANAMDGDREECLKAGADRYMAKPVDIEKLISMISKMIT